MTKAPVEEAGLSDIRTQKAGKHLTSIQFSSGGGRTRLERDDATEVSHGR